MVAVLIVAALLVCMAAGAATAQLPHIVGRLPRRTTPVLGLIIVAIAISFVAVARDGAETSQGAAMSEAAVIAVVLSILGLGAFLFGLNLAGFDPDASSIADRLAIDPTSRQLLSRWTHRVRWRRWVGGVAGVVLALFSGNSGWILFAGIGGAALGSISAQLHLCRPSPRQNRVVSLERRAVADYIDRRTVIGLVGVSGLTIAVGVWSLVLERPAVWWLVAGVAAVALTPGLIWLVVHRRRPALSPELHAADDLLRRLAVSNGIAQPVMSLALALVATGLARGGADDAAFVVGCAAVFGWWRNRRGGLDYVLKHPVKTAHLLARPESQTAQPTST